MIVLNVKSATTKELVAAYNQATGKSIKKFSSRAAGEKQTAAAIAKFNDGSASDIAQSALLPPKKPAKVKGARKVRSATTAEKSGRPQHSFTVSLQTGVSHPNSKSLRRQLITYLEKRPSAAATIDKIEEHFGRNMRGVINKLQAKKWLSVTRHEA